MFIMVYCYNCSLILTIVNLLLCLTYTLNFITGMYISEETQYIQGSVLSTVSEIQWGLGMYLPVDEWQLLYRMCSMSLLLSISFQSLFSIFIFTDFLGVCVGRGGCYICPHTCISTIQERDQLLLCPGHHIFWGWSCLMRAKEKAYTVTKSLFPQKSRGSSNLH